MISLTQTTARICQKSVLRCKSSSIHCYHEEKIMVTLDFCRQHRLSIVTEAVEPPIDNIDVKERPCTIILAEDLHFYKQLSWKDDFQSQIPNNYGMTFRYLTMSPSVDSLERGLNELQSDLLFIPDAVLVARGPFMSWYAQYYLESFALLGLVMVDPVQFHITTNNHEPHNIINNDKVLDSIKKHLEATDETIISTHEFGQLQSFLEGKEVRPLKLEPNAIPMIVWNTVSDHVLYDSALETAMRHSDPDGPYGTISVHDFQKNIDNKDKPHNIIVSSLCDWVDSHVL